MFSLGIIWGIIIIFIALSNIGESIFLIFQLNEIFLILGLASSYLMITGWDFLTQVRRDIQAYIFGKNVIGYEEIKDAILITFALLKKIRIKGLTSIEADLEMPQESSIFKDWKTMNNNPAIYSFIQNIFNILLIDNNLKGAELTTQIQKSIQAIKKNQLKTAHILNNLADAMPALGILAALMEIMHIMKAYINDSPEVIGTLMAVAMSGTFIGIWIAYSILQPLAGKMIANADEHEVLFTAILSCVFLYIENKEPIIAIQYACTQLPINIPLNTLESLLRQVKV